ncbi:TatD family hydrolase [Kushneria phosphatilytica]|uniref:TatD family deoxyribonuclease n=1 Tax=Kushneria phosphatilytica TaxID=657387 RepID=A0A1S1NV25_9GAMM|nr:TatD family hydrolase [Kushneria phosphatilytica]OHV11811.1 hydrolase TatD [Kushneria phosphatilytica]QEL10977.1 TatD family deoxyribonuclease [Kushneria phosphatilytica]
MSAEISETLSSEIGLVDSHCHLDRLIIGEHETREQHLDEVLCMARRQGVRRCLAMATDWSGLPWLVSMARRHEEIVYAGGVHPLVAADREMTLEEIEAAIERFDPVAIGEIGLDFLPAEDTGQPRVDRDRQLERFATHLQAARRAELPVSIHTRGARETTLEMIARYSDPEVGGVLHCFTEDLDMARQAIGLGFYISLSGIVTFARAESVRELARYIPLDRLLIETDSPWLAPVPHRGQPNQPGHVIEVARTIAEVRGISLDEVAMQTTSNFYRLFRQAVPESVDS